MTDEVREEDRIADYLAQALAAIDRGEALDVAELCREHPELATAVGEALGLRGGLPSLHDRAQEVQDRRGEVLAGRYRLEQCVGQGAVGMVFRATDLQLPREVAVKVLHRQIGSGVRRSPEVEARFRREAELLAQHEHRHIVRIYDHGRTDDGTQFLVTELLRGVSLQQVLEASDEALAGRASSASFARIDWLRALLPDAELETTYLQQIVKWIDELASGLAIAHADGVFHRDIKPSNVFLRADGSAVLLDFGIAAREGDAAMTLPHAIVGTPCYMAPEQAAGRPEPRPSIDVYGLTATLYHLLTLRPPHEGDLQTVLAAVRTSDPEPAVHLHPGLPRDLQAILDCGLEHDLGRRYSDIRALGDDVHAFREHRPVSVRPLGAARRFARGCARRPARSLAFLLGAALVAAMAVLAPLWATAEAHAMAREKAELLAHLPADLAVEGWPDQRALIPVAERQKVVGELDRLLELDPGNRYVRVMRAAERLDGGDPAGAADDFAELGRRAESAYLREVAARYRSVAERTATESAKPMGHNAIDLEGLPPPERGADFFVAGFHALRAWNFDRADELLSQCAEFVPARDLRLLARLGSKRPDPEALLAEAGWLEGHYGQPTARTRHVMAVAMIFMRKYDRAVAYARESLELRPDRHGPWNNLGLALLRTGRLEEAKAALEKAVSLRSWFPNSLGNLCQTLRDLGDFEGAIRTAERMPDEPYREHELGNVCIERAMQAAIAGDDSARAAFAKQARAHFEAAASAAERGATRHPKLRAIPAAIAYADLLANPDRRETLLAYLRGLARDPANPKQIANVAGFLAEVEVDEDLRDELRLYLFEIAAALAPGQQSILRERDELDAELQKRRQ
ncbi:MAG: protein kinase [Planctomycetes bacterium]|nr:protein kinase [Planctomycetota bacterium]